jgi:hypothetical protein
MALSTNTSSPSRGLGLRIYLWIIFIFIPLNSLHIMFLVLNNNPAIADVNGTVLSVFLNMMIFISAILLYNWNKIGAYGLIFIPCIGLIKSIFFGNPTNQLMSQALSLIIIVGLLLFLLRNKWPLLK